VSFTGNGPALQSGLVYDHASGAYAGAFLSNVRFADQSSGALQMAGFAGYAHRSDAGTAIDLGAAWSGFSDGRGYDYGEIYAGVANEGIAARLSYAPRYFGQPSGAWYLEASGSHALSGHFRILAHLGVLHLVGSGEAGAAHDVVDGRLGVGADLDAVSIKLEWVGVSNIGYVYPLATGARRSNAVVSIARAF
jgi:uncharacterized protein (TIGR02001 family)